MQAHGGAKNVGINYVIIMRPKNIEHSHLNIGLYYNSGFLKYVKYQSNKLALI